MAKLINIMLIALAAFALVSCSPSAGTVPEEETTSATSCPLLTKAENDSINDLIAKFNAESKKQNKTWFMWTDYVMTNTEISARNDRYMEDDNLEVVFIKLYSNTAIWMNTSYTGLNTYLNQSKATGKTGYDLLVDFIDRVAEKQLKTKLSTSS